MDIWISLMRRCKNNDKEAFNSLLSHHEAYLYKICYFYTQNQETALDIMQEVFLKIYRSIHTFDENRPLLPWLKRIAVNTCLNFQRDNKKYNQLSLDLELSEELSLKDTIKSQMDVEGEVIRHSNQELIGKCIEALPPNYRIALTLKYIEDMRYEEIAAVLEQPLGTVKSNIFRARNLLKNTLKDYNLLEV
ncbi:MAG: hypothetical protein JM58_16460 [Peptococcaceae bacterium BICA1-8]|nr:MAG: hypothetical protein JM58_16460 [Peptococcaceae bacterium BICA1-8]